MRSSKVDEDARMLMPSPNALREAKRNIDLAVADHDLTAITHWTSVWFKVQEIALRQVTDVDPGASSKASPSAGRRSPHRRLPAGTLVALSD